MSKSITKGYRVNPNKREFGRLKILDSIRGMAALLVLYHHLFKFNKEIFKSQLTNTFYEIAYFISELNKEAVLLFFIISGFSIGLSTFKKPLRNINSYNTYLYRRFRRILPIYWLALFIALLVGVVLDLMHLYDFSILNFVGNLLFLQTSRSISESWFVPYGLNGPLWSLSFEMFFYLFFLLVYYLNEKYLVSTNLYLKYISLLMLVFGCLLINKKILFSPFFLFFAGFVTWIQGYIASLYFTNWKKNNLFFSANFILGIFIILFKSSIPSETILLIGKGMFMNGLFYFVMISCDKVKIGNLKEFVNKIFYKIGVGSYAIYAFHYPFLIYFESKQVPFIYQLLFIIPFVFCCYFLEQESLKWKLRFLELNYLKSFKFIS